MSKVFLGQNVTLEDMLTAREARMYKQKDILGKYPTYTLVSVSMNIPGQIKNSDILSMVFEEMLAELDSVLSDIVNVYKNNLQVKTGREALILTKMSNVQVKRLLVSLEENKALNRLFDLDVIYLEGDSLKQLSRQDLQLPKRQCLICDEEAKVCSRSRAHTVEELQEKIERLIINE